MVRYYGWYSNVARGKRQKLAEDGAIPYIIEFGQVSGGLPEKLGQADSKISEVDPLICPKCRGTMRIISFIEDWEIIKTILSYLGPWLNRLSFHSEYTSSNRIFRISCSISVRRICHLHW